MVKVPGCPRLHRPSGYLSTALFFAALCGSAAVLRSKDCQFPDPSDHTTYRCMSPVCKLSLGSGVFKAGSMVQHFCEAGYVLAGHPGVSVCKGGQWSMLKPVVCKPLAGSPVPRPGSVIAVSSIPMVAAASVTASALLLVAMVCVLVGPKPCSYWCWRWYEPMEESEESTVDSCPVPLPSYEEAVYGSQGGPVLPAPPTLTPLVLSRGLAPPSEAAEPCWNPEAATPPPSYQESQAAAAGGSGLARPTVPPARFLFPGAAKDLYR
ncbi:sushi domain-containing protein 6-like [Gopherus evgoodei]|uniref:sushi domain-containing protein 6-like n=1 Tax=Gopherus evgoodei TaxID=1825980 RepID=UPI0011CF02A0|nr:sushi domain-containing protein 6-like [Gopherus evgoodei]XP_030400296.1 sushi domain-containing protein 6-like [Gopherus evgoodei]